MRIGIVGAGILGLAVARQMARAGAEVTVLEKEPRIAAHQTGHNSGVVHAGIYYQPGSLKATLCREGAAMLREYCAEHGLPYDEAGKLVVASTRAELSGLRRIAERARENGVPGIAELDAIGLREVEPRAVGVAAVHSPHTAITDFPAVARRLAADVTEAGGFVRLSRPVRAIRQTTDGVAVAAGPERLTFDRLISCAGLGTDGVADLARAGGDVRIVPFRGEYYRLAGPARGLVKGLIYPVPDPRYPFLGVHLTRRIDGEVLVGPNAVPALALEGYSWRSASLRDLRRIAAWPGARRMAAEHWRTGLREVYGSLAKRAFVAAARRYVPELAPADLVRAGGGVRAQAVARDGRLLDDFVIDVRGRIVLVRNAPSPAATSSLAIARHIALTVPLTF
ncbi:L-2-hydroxyglutarate oxidase [Microbispora bryophytorum]|uniref:Hydroxyglutarate oxidase n=1 Tax=Microbispora bryophytorum TaxID=1460882 RepID=A0A8H9LH38_9ACTN|nr:L-2-hydroxyglutarate oxidase [Microbispora bryophytorum]MBD3141054.1 L-2-hydroxyglutarate oxidase [Microbispora bryophytorum]TQS02159.1 L-2-hydroxyglutarate oxidase [Microbispora bryophytorum]GGO29592.1 hydroxyglutarate oxidase [Microbispora bryophytorum]